MATASATLELRECQDASFGAPLCGTLPVIGIEAVAGQSLFSHVATPAPMSLFGADPVSQGRQTDRSASAKWYRNPEVVAS